MAHTKRIAAGYGKKHKWVTTPNPGKHKKEDSIPLMLVVRDILGYADTSREVKKIIHNGLILVDKKPRKDPKYGVGLMDVIDIPKANRHFRVIPGKKGLNLKEIDEKESKIKLCEILNKRVVSKDKIQLNLHDSSNIIISNGKYNPRDTIVLDLYDRKIMDVIKFEKDNIGMIVHGRHIGNTGKIDEIIEGTTTRKSLTRIGEIQTLTDYIFVIGREESLISL